MEHMLWTDMIKHDQLFQHSTCLESLLYYLYSPHSDRMKIDMHYMSGIIVLLLRFAT